jgi:polysaccharide biosynthesis protein PslG
MVWNNSANKPTVPFGGMRLWDVGATWNDLEPSNGTFNWGALDSRLAYAQTQGLDVLYTMGKVPGWISSNPGQACFSGTGCAAPPTDVDTGDATYKAFVTALVKHSLASTTAHIKYYELWNEPNYPAFWSGSTAQLVIMNNDASDIIHALDPNALTVGPSPTGWGPDTWINGWYTAGGTHDIISFHSKYDLAADVTNIANIKAVAAANGDSAKPLWNTEGSWGAHNNTIFTDDQKVAFLAQQYLLYWNNGITRFYWYAWDNKGNYGPLWDPITGIHPAGTAYGLLGDWLVDSDYPDQPCSQAADATWTCTLTLHNGSPAQIVWNPSTSKTFSTTFGTYRTLDNGTVNSITGGTVVVGNKPILLN